MMSHSKKVLLSSLPGRGGYTFPEVMVSLAILAAVGAGVLVVFDRCMASSADMVLRMQAFELARDNMENLLALQKVQEMTEYGESELYPDITWRTVVQPFYEPVGSRMWVQAVCSAEYFDTEGELRTVELTHWLTSMTKEQIKQLAEEKLEEKLRLAEADQLVQTVEEAAEYAGVDEQTIQEWLENGMPRTEDGEFIKLYLDLYSEYDGDPQPEVREEVDLEYKDLTGSSTIPGSGGPGGPSSGLDPGPSGQSDTPPITREILEKFGIPQELWPASLTDGSED
ncbi:MAG: hypothetical protein ACYTBJ_09670 [Planctomycetota bacterium]|jgi:hypothetical protein